jgi:GTP-binding protein
MTHKAYQSLQFLKSAVQLDQLPADEGFEVAFIGRSNAGKSSALNTITGIKGLARTSKTPGRTSALNYFTLDKSRRLVDLPGYGYAKVPLVVKERWAQLIDGYLQQRQCLKGLVLVMDIRHPLKELDLQIIDWTARCELPMHILLTKSDKLKRAQTQQTLRKVREDLQAFGDLISVQLFSSLDKIGVEEANSIIGEWLDWGEKYGIPAAEQVKA